MEDDTTTTAQLLRQQNNYLARIVLLLEAIASSRKNPKFMTGLGSALAPKKLSVGRYTRDGREYCWSLDGKPIEENSLTGTIQKISTRELPGTQHGDLTMILLYLNTENGPFIIETNFPNYFGKSLISGLLTMSDEQLRETVTIKVEPCETESERGKKVIYCHLFDSENNVVNTIFDKQYKKGHEDYWMSTLNAVRSRIAQLAASSDSPSTSNNSNRDEILANISVAMGILGWGNKQGSDKIKELFSPAKTRAELSVAQLEKFASYLSAEIDKVGD
jgi:hypothetical protein